MASTLCCKGWYLEDSDISEVKKLISLAEDTNIDKDVRFTALYVAMTSNKIGWSKFEGLCTELGLFGDLGYNLDIIEDMLIKL